MTQAQPNIDWASLCEPVARIVWGAPSMETPKELRWGTHGSRALNRQVGTWYDHENNIGGGTLHLVPGTDITAKLRWLSEHRLVDSAPKPASGERPCIIATYSYVDEDNKLLFEVVRFHPKEFRQRRPDGHGGWSWSLGEVRRVLYRLPEFATAIDLGDVVYVPEGEKDVDALRAQKLVATCNPGGAGKWRAEYNESVRGADVVVIADHDQAGRDHARQVAAAIHGVAERVRILDLGKIWPECPPKGDVSDWIEAGGTAEKLAAIAGALPDWERGETTARDYWPEPKPLPTGLAPVEAFSSEFMPDALAPWVDDIANRLQCPPDYVAVAAITALGSVIGRRIGIKPQRKTDWIETPNLWGLFIGRPGMLKSPAMMEALKPIHWLEAECAKANQAAQDKYVAELNAFKVRKEVAISLKKRELKKTIVDLNKFKRLAEEAEAKIDLVEPAAPIPIRYRTNDSSYEAIGELLIANPSGILVERDEITSLLKHLDRDDQTVARGFYLSGWSGLQSYTFDRIGRGTRHVEAICIAVLGNTQPARISEYVRRANLGGAGGDGLIQRFGLLVWPDAPPDWRDVDEYPDANAREAARQLFNRLSKMNTDAALKAGALKGEYDNIPYLRFDDHAAVDFIGWREDLERRVRSGELSPAFEGHIAKYRKLVPALALINHLADGGEGPVSQSALLRALAFASYLESHAKRVYGSTSESELAAAKAILKHIRNGVIADGFTARDIHQRGWAHLTEREHVGAGLELLTDHEYLAAAQAATRPQGGRPKVTYQINPKGLQ